MRGVPGILALLVVAIGLSTTGFWWIYGGRPDFAGVAARAQFPLRVVTIIGAVGTCRAGGMARARRPRE